MVTTGTGRTALGVAVLSAAAELAGCGAAVPDVLEGPRPSQVAVPSLDHCPSRPGELPRFDDHGWLIGSGRVPEQFHPVGVVRCRWVSDFASGSARKVVIEEDRTASVTAAFLSSLELRDQVLDPDSHMACAAVATSLQYLILVDAKGRAVVPHLPEEPCGAPRDEVEQAVADLGLAVFTTYRVDVPA